MLYGLFGLLESSSKAWETLVHLSNLYKIIIAFFISFFWFFLLYQRVPNLIGGKFVDSQSSSTIDVINPVSIWTYNVLSLVY